MSVIFVLLHVSGQVIDIELWYTKHITFVSSHNLKDGSIFQLCWKRFLSVPMKRWHVVSDWTVCLRSNFKDRSTSSVMYTSAVHPHHPSIFPSRRRRPFSKSAINLKQFPMRWNEICQNFWSGDVTLLFVKPAFRFSTWSRNWKRSIMYPPPPTCLVLYILLLNTQQ